MIFSQLDCHSVEEDGEFDWRNQSECTISVQVLGLAYSADRVVESVHSRQRVQSILSEKPGNFIARRAALVVQVLHAQLRLVKVIYSSPDSS